MLLFPAIDIMGGKCVRLLYGDKNKVTVYGDPVDTAKRWCDEGAEYLHVVDLDGAFSGVSENLKIIERIIKSINIPVQLGGGIRTMTDIKNRIETGVQRVILGTSAYSNPGLVEEAAAEFEGRIAAGIDVKNGRVAIKGWVEEADVQPVEFGKSLFEKGIRTVIYTDISRDGALTGVNYGACKCMQDETGLNIIASGGVSSLDDIIKLSGLGVYGAILGKALYTGNIKLSEALKI